MSINPTFLLRGLDPSQIISDYQAGKFSCVSDVPSKVTLAASISVTDYNDSPDSEIYYIRNRSNNQVNVITTNHQAYKAAQDGTSYHPQHCLWCRRSFDTEPVGIPTRMVVTDQTYTFFVDRPSYCSFECCLAEICRDNYRCHRDPFLVDAETLIRFFYRLATGEDQLRPAPDWWLLDVNGGPLTYDDYKVHHYSRTPSIITLPFKMTYML